jgi:hypothetical protein
MGPWEFVAALIVVPLVAVMVWIQRRFLDVDGASVPEFEAWCRGEKPVLFAMRCAPDRAREVAHETAVAVGAAREVVNHQGTHPWTRYVFELEVSRDESKGVVWVRAVDCSLRRGTQTRPEIGRVLEGLFDDVAGDVSEVWLHGALHATEHDALTDRRKYGWIASHVGHGERDFAPMIGRPVWM